MDWDVAIVGAGMGGAAFGYAVAKAGYKVLFIEKGLSSFGGNDDEPDATDPEHRLKNGRWPTPIVGRINDQTTSFYPSLGCGAGGSTLLYAATLERFSRKDFSSRSTSSKPAWPISYDELEPYYRRVEALFRVRGTPDPFYNGPAAPLRPPPTMSSSDSELFAVLKRNGLQPYRTHNACEADADCLSCGGTICHRSCKHDAKGVFLDPLLASGQASILDQCTVERIDADRFGVTKLICRRHGEEVVVQARHYALAAGAYATPMLLLGSANAYWPNGIANSSDMVGRNLMFHVSDFLAVWPRGRGKNIKPERAIAIRDYDRSSHDDLGMIQSAGMSASPRNIMHVLTILIDTGRFRLLRPLRRFVQVPAVLIAWVLGKATIFATIIEDHPYPGNRVRPHRDHPGTIFFEYTVSEELRQRVRRFRRLYRQAFRRRRTLVLTPAVNLNFGHPCGTCRAGVDPKDSVVDAQNRSHDLKNLYVVDASWFPTSGGVNPSLTVAANALRAGSLLVATMAETALTLAEGIDLFQDSVALKHDACHGFECKEDGSSGASLVAG